MQMLCSVFAQWEAPRASSFLLGAICHREQAKRKGRALLAPYSCFCLVPSLSCLPPKGDCHPPAHNPRALEGVVLAVDHSDGAATGSVLASNELPKKGRNNLLEVASVVTGFRAFEQ